MSNAKIDNIQFSKLDYIKQELNAIKNEYDKTYSDHSNINSKYNTQYYGNSDPSIRYNGTSTVPNTILITNNYSQDGRSARQINKSIKKNSITIVTHNADSEHSLNKMPTSRRNPTVVLDRINICINNHFNDSISNMQKSSLLTDLSYKSDIDKTINTDSNTGNSKIFSMRDKTKQQDNKLNNTFLNGEDVLVQRKDARYYLGTIVAIARNQCLVKFDDNTEYWSNFDELSKLSTNGSSNDPICVVCKKINNSETAEVCERCGRGYHPKCAEGSFQKNGIWYCRRCTAPNGMKTRSHDYKFDETSSQVYPNPITHKSQLPYNLDSLIWDEHRRVNLEQIYCYCGKNGEWYNKMLQCCKCQQWFHDKCVSCLTGPIYAGDRFYIFVCSMCNRGREFLRRLEMKWNDLVHLLLFNITINKNKKYYHADNVIIPYAIDNWPLLQLNPNMRNLSPADIRENVIKTLSMNNTRFKCGREIKKGQFFWGLRSRIPPPAPKILIPFEVKVNDHYLRKYSNFNVIQPKSLAELPTDVDAKMTGMIYLGENSDNESSSNSSDQKFTSDDELPIKRIIEREKCETTKKTTNKIINKTINKVDITNSKMTRGPNEQIQINNDHGVSNSSTDLSEKSQDCAEYDKGESMDVDDCVKNKNNHVKHNRKRKSLFFSTVMQQIESKNADIVDICDSSDETSSRGTLDLIIPPPKNFQGKNNPFRLTPKKKDNKTGKNNRAHSRKKIDPKTQNSALFRIVRTVKRKLSANDIMIGPNQEVKRRRLRRRSGNVEVISTTTLQSLPKSAAYLPIRSDCKELPVSAIRSTLHTSSSSASSAATTPTNLGYISNVFTGRRLRERKEKNYSESQRRNSNSSIGTVSSNNGVTSTIPGSSGKNSTQSSDVSLSELKTSVNMYFGAANRIANGEHFVVRAKRLSPCGKVQYLIEWEGLS